MGLRRGRGSDGKGEGGHTCRELGPAAPSKYFAATAISLAEAARGSCPTCALLAIRMAGDVYCFHHTCLEPDCPHVGSRVAGEDATRVGKRGLCLARGAVWEIRRGSDTRGTDSSAWLSWEGSQEALVCLTPISWVEEEQPAQEACPPGKGHPLSTSQSLPVQPSSDGPRNATLLSGYVETCGVSFPEFPLTFLLSRAGLSQRQSEICSVAFT